MKTQKIIDRETTIRISIITHAHPELLKKFPNLTFIPKKLAIRVGGIRSNDTRVKTFMILFWSRLMIPRTVFWRYSRRSKPKSVWLIRDEMSFRRTLSLE